MKANKRISKGLKFAEGGQKPAAGRVSYTVFKNGEPVETVNGRNLIVDSGRAQTAHLIAGDFSGRSISSIAFGVNGKLPSADDENLTGAFVKDLEGYSFPAAGEVQFDWSLKTTEANGMAIMEFGLMTENGTLFSRRVRENENGGPSGKPINKEGDISIIGQWIITF